MPNMEVTTQDWQSLAQGYLNDLNNAKLENAVLRRTIVEMEAAQAAEKKPDEVKPKGK